MCRRNFLFVRLNISCRSRRRLILAANITLWNVWSEVRANMRWTKHVLYESTVTANLSSSKDQRFPRNKPAALLQDQLLKRQPDLAQLGDTTWRINLPLQFVRLFRHRYFQRSLIMPSFMTQYPYREYFLFFVVIYFWEFRAFSLCFVFHCSFLFAFCHNLYCSIRQQWRNHNFWFPILIEKCIRHFATQKGFLLEKKTICPMQE